MHFRYNVRHHKEFRRLSPHPAAAAGLSFTIPTATPEDALPLLVCSTCRAPLPEGTRPLPPVRPGSLALLATEHLPAAAAAAGRRSAGHSLARALGRQYRVVRLLGRGGFAEVYEVRDEDLQRRLAVKVLRADIPWSEATLSGFKQEGGPSRGSATPTRWPSISWARPRGWCST